MSREEPEREILGGEAQEIREQEHAKSGTEMQQQEQDGRNIELNPPKEHGEKSMEEESEEEEITGTAQKRKMVETSGEAESRGATYKEEQEGGNGVQVTPQKDEYQEEQGFESGDRGHGGPYLCRICFEEYFDSDTEADTGLIQPCLCLGSARLVHRHCLDVWRATKQGDAFTHCGTCKFKYKVVKRSIDVKELWWYRLKVSRDLALLLFCAFLLVAMSSLATAQLSKHLDHNGISMGSILGLHPFHSWELSHEVDERHLHLARPTHTQQTTTLELELPFPALHDPACPFFLWFGAGAVLFCVLLGTCSIFAWLFNLFPQDFEVHWPTCNCFVLGGPLVLLAILGLAAFGLVMGVSISLRLAKQRFIRHATVTWLYDETKRHIVQDCREIQD